MKNFALTNALDKKNSLFAQHKGSPLRVDFYIYIIVVITFSAFSF